MCAHVADVVFSFQPRVLPPCIIRSCKTIVTVEGAHATSCEKRREVADVAPNIGMIVCA